MPHPVEQEELRALIQRFAGRRVAVVGDVVVDEYLYGHTDRISREAPVLIVQHESTDRFPGGAANAAANLASLGAHALLVGAIGDDEAGRSLEALCGAIGVESRLATCAGIATETKTRILAGGINTTRQQMLRLDRSRGGPLPASAKADLIERIRLAAADADVVIVSDYGGGVLEDETIAAVRELAAAGVKICVDSRYNLTAYRGVLVAKPNEPELGAATGAPVGTASQSVEAGTALRKTLGATAVLVTRGRSGMTLLQEDAAPALIPVHGQTEAVDVTGAGDTVIATFALALAAGGSFLAASRIANIAGALVVRKMGTATVTVQELMDELA